MSEIKNYCYIIIIYPASGYALINLDLIMIR